MEENFSSGSRIQFVAACFRRYISMPQSATPGLNLKNSNPEERTLKNYKESDYALNKYSQGIVYKFVDGALEVTLEDYLRDNPDKTEDDFAELKALSDEIYHEQVVLEHRTCRKNISIDLVPETELVITPEFDVEQMERREQSEKSLQAAHKLLHSGLLTTVQQRRFLLHFFHGLSIRQIAEMEKVHQRAVWDSLMWAEKKLKKIF